MTDPQAGIVYRYFSVDADHDISSDTLEVSLDETTWNALDYLPPVNYPPSVTAADTAHPPASGYSRYWWRALTGPGQALPLDRGVVLLFGRLTDSPEVPNFAWTFRVGAYE